MKNFTVAEIREPVHEFHLYLIYSLISFQIRKPENYDILFIAIFQQVSNCLRSCDL